MEINIEGGGRKEVHGTDAQFLIEKLFRERIYECLYWKEKMFGCNAADIVDRGADLRAVGGRFGNQKPTEFINCVLKLLQLMPEQEIILFFIQQPNYKYLTALGAFYLRLTAKSHQIYQYLEPLLMDKRKIRRRTHEGSYELTFMDEFVDQLLTNTHSCDTILPRLTKRYILEDNEILERRISPLEVELEDEWEDEDILDSEKVDQQQEEPSEVPQNEEILIPLDSDKKKPSKKKVKGLFKKEKPKPVVEKEDQEEDAPKPLFKDGSLSFHESNILRANLGLAPLKPPPSAPSNIKK